MLEQPTHRGKDLTAPAPDIGFSNPVKVCLLCVCAAWFGNGLYALGEPGGPLKNWSSAIVASAMISFVLIHGRHTGGWRSVLLFMSTVIPVGWVAESLSMVTGFPFGDYRYSESMGPFLGRVPVAVLPAYCVMGYFSWSMARILLRRVDCEVDRTLLLKGPIVAAALMVIWDISMDPLRATVEHRWIWLRAGLHYGIPLSNFIGWFGVTWVMFQLYAGLLARRSRIVPPVDMRSAEQFWYAAPLMYLSFAVEYIANPLLFAGHDATLTMHGMSIELQQLYQGVAVIAAATMLPVSLLTVSRVKLAVMDMTVSRQRTAR